MIGTSAGYTQSGCWNTGDITYTATATASSYVGGVFGSVGSDMDGCFNSGTITSAAYYTAGVAGSVLPTANTTRTVEDCYNIGNITVDTGTLSPAYCYVSGVGGSDASTTVTYYESYINCYNTGTLNATTLSSNCKVGGISSDRYSAAGTSRITYANCYYGGSYTLNEVIYEEWDDVRDGLSYAPDAFATGEVAYYLDGGTGTHRNVWTQDTANGYPVFSHTSGDTVRRIQATVGENGAIGFKGFIGDTGSGIEMTSADASSVYAMRGMQITIEAAGDTDYVVDSLSVDGAGVMYEDGDPPYVFTVGTNDIPVVVSFAYDAGGTTFTITFYALVENDPYSQPAYFAGDTNKTTITYDMKGSLDATQLAEINDITRQQYTAQNGAAWQYELVGWADENGNAVYPETKKFLSDLKVYAQWKNLGEINVTANLNLPAGTSYTGSAAYDAGSMTFTAVKGDTLSTLENPICVLDGGESSSLVTYQFDKWLDDNNAQFSPAGYLSDALTELVLTAQWDMLISGTNTNGSEGTVLGEIENQSDLEALASAVRSGNDFTDTQFSLKDNFTVDNTTWEGIGVWDSADASKCRAFNGTFDGNGKTITIDNTDVGLFIYLEEDANVLDVNLEGTVSGNEVCLGALVHYNYGTIDHAHLDVTVKNQASQLSTEKAYTGGMVGRNNGEIINCQVRASVEAPLRVGGIVGLNGDGTCDAKIENCWLFAGSLVEGSERVGGIAAYNCDTATLSSYDTIEIIGCTVEEDSTITSSGDYTGGIVGGSYGDISDCSNGATVTVTDTARTRYYAGGITGHVAAPGTLTDCENTGNIYAPTVMYAGGIAGYLRLQGGTGAYTAENCTNSGNVTAYRWAGGIAGKVATIITLDNCYNSGDITSMAEAAGGIIAGGADTLEQCVNMGNVSGGTEVGGLVGTNYLVASFSEATDIGSDRLSSLPDIINCYSIGVITATGSTSYSCGGFVGLSASGDVGGAISNSFYISMDNSYLNPYDDKYVSLNNCYYGAGMPDTSDPIRAYGLVYAQTSANATFNSGEIAYLLDGGTGAHNNVWTQGEEYPELGDPSYYKAALSDAPIENGTISLTGTYFGKGQTVTVDATPDVTEDEAYVLESLIVTYEDGSEATTASGSSFTMPAGNVLITATFALQDEVPPTETPPVETPPVETPPSGGTISTLKKAVGAGQGTTSGDGTGNGYGDDTGNGIDNADNGTGTDDTNGGGGDDGTTTPSDTDTVDIPGSTVPTVNMPEETDAASHADQAQLPQSTRKDAAAAPDVSMARPTGGGSSEGNTNEETLSVPEIIQEAADEPDTAQDPITVLDTTPEKTTQNPLIIALILVVVALILLWASVRRYRKSKKNIKD
ncbi:MAG: hypothetical protein LUG13_07180 [Oscillospiraceae bacterium]|nr:hypothetical protein [Oscillospiraceae bacterium]